MLNQQIFDTVCKHLAQQKTRSVDTEGNCMYKAPDGKMCAIGVLVKDYYQPNWEHSTPYEIFTATGVDGLITGWLHDNETPCPYVGVPIDLLIRLQWAHDHNRSLVDLQSELDEVARKFDLKWDEVINIEEWSSNN